MAQKKKGSWSHLDHETRLKRIEELWNQGLSDKAIADELSATKGQIVGYRHTHLPHVTGASRQKAPIEPERSPTPPEPAVTARSSPPVAPTPPTPATNVMRKMTADWRKQCGHFDEDDRQCGYEYTVERNGEKRCDLHAHEIEK